MTYPPFLLHPSSGTIVNTKTGICVASRIETNKIGKKSEQWSYLYGFTSMWEPCDNPDPSVWTDPFGISHKL